MSASNLASALVKAQSEFPPIPKDSVNPHFKNRFASLHAVMEKVLPVLNANGLALMQMPTTHDGQPALRTKLVHAESGEFEEDTMLLVLAKNDPQSQGSALSYARRYAVLSTLGLVADEDDDGAAASKPAAAKRGGLGTAASPDRVARQPEKAAIPAQILENSQKTGSDDKPNQDQLAVIDRLITELAALRGVERGTVIKSLDEKPMTEQWRTSETSAVFAIDRLRSWAKQAAAEAGVVAS